MHRARVPEHALESLQLLFDLSEKLERQFVMTVLVRQSLATKAMRLLREIAAAPGFDARAAQAALASRLAAARHAGELVQTLRSERAHGLGLIDRWLAGEISAENLGILQTWFGAPIDDLVGWIQSSWLARPLVYRDGSMFLDVMGEAIRIAEGGGDFASFDERVDGLDESYLVSRGWGQLAKRLHLQTDQFERERRLTSNGLEALATYQATGRWPGGLRRTAKGVRIAEGDQSWLIEPKD